MRFSDEELKHQELFRRIDDLIGETLPAGYRFDVDPDAVAGVVLGKSTWAVLALTLPHRAVHPAPLPSEHRAGRRALRAVQGRVPPSLEGGEPARDPRRARVEAARRRVDRGGTRPRRSTSSSSWWPRWTASSRRKPPPMPATSPHAAGARWRSAEAQAIEAGFRKAYRWQYIHSGAAHPRFRKVLSSLITAEQGRRIEAALAGLH